MQKIIEFKRKLTFISSIENLNSKRNIGQKRNEENLERMIASLKERRKAFLESSNYFMFLILE